MPTTIVWMSRHPPTPSQVRELDRHFPDHNFHVQAHYSTPEDAIEKFKAARGDELFIVAPWSVLNQIVALGVRPLVARMERVPCSSPAAEIVLGQGKSRRCQRFIRFERVRGANLDTEPLT